MTTQKKPKNSHTARAALAAGAKTPTEHGLMVSPFVYETSFGDITLPGFVPSGVLRKHRNKPELDIVFAIIEEFEDDEVTTVVDQLPIDEVEGVQGSLMGLFTQWMGGTPGESKAS